MHYTIPVGTIHLVVFMNGGLWVILSRNSDMSNNAKVVKTVMIHRIYTTKYHTASKKNNVETYEGIYQLEC